MEEPRKRKEETPATATRSEVLTVSRLPTGLHLGLPLPPRGAVPLWPLSGLGNSPQSGISKPEPPVWYLKARAPPLSGLLLGLPLLPRGVV